MGPASAGGVGGVVLLRENGLDNPPNGAIMLSGCMSPSTEERANSGEMPAAQVAPLAL